MLTGSRGAFLCDLCGIPFATFAVKSFSAPAKARNRKDREENPQRSRRKATLSV
jgi:hypothetical protein